MLVAVPFVVIITAFVIIGLATTSQSQSSAWVSWLNQYGGILGSTLALGIVAATDLARWATHKIGEHFQGIERLAVAWLAALFHYADRVLGFAFAWPIELGKLAFWLLDVEIPRLIRAIPGAATRVIHQTVVRVQRIERTVIRLPKLTRKQAEQLIGAAVALYIAPYLYPLRWLRQHFHALTAVLPHTLPIPFGRTIANIKNRLRRLEKAGVGTIAVAALVAVLAKAKLGFLRCGNFRRAGNRICHMDMNLLDEILIDTLAIASIISVVEFANVLRSIEGEAVKILGAGIREFPST